MEKTYKENIHGVEVIFTSTESEEYTKRIVELVRKNIDSVIKSGDNVTVPKAAIVACMSLCEQLEQIRSENDLCISEKHWAENEAERIGKEIERIKAENDELRSEVLRLKIELSNKG